MCCHLVCFTSINQTVFFLSVIEEPSKRTVFTETLTIDKVSRKDFETEFKCTGIGISTKKSVTLSLKQRGQ